MPLPPHQSETSSSAFVTLARPETSPSGLQGRTRSLPLCGSKRKECSFLCFQEIRAQVNFLRVSDILESKFNRFLCFSCYEISIIAYLIFLIFILYFLFLLPQLNSSCKWRKVLLSFSQFYLLWGSYLLSIMRVILLRSSHHKRVPNLQQFYGGIRS